MSKQQKPTNREAFNPIIETQPRSHETRNPICVGQIVENDQTAHISLQIFNFQRARRQNCTSRQFPSASRLSYLQVVLRRLSLSASSSAPSVSPRRLRFGEAVSRPTHPNPQEEKTLHMTFSCQSQCLLGFFSALWQSFATADCQRFNQPAKLVPATAFTRRIQPLDR